MESRLQQELEVLQSIYGDNIFFELQPQLSADERSSENVNFACFRVVFIAENFGTIVLKGDASYPEHSCPSIDITLSHRSTALERVRDDILSRTRELVVENVGNEVMFQAIELARDALNELQSDSQPRSVDNSDESDETDANWEQLEVAHHTAPDSLLERRIIHGPVIVERKSSFQAHLMEVNSMDEVSAFRMAIVRDKRYARATHNIFAYRFANLSTKVVHHDCDDDGETAAGSRLAEMIRLMHPHKGVAVVVSRWFGGVLLGPDRFKFICNVARKLLEESGFVK